MNEQSYLSQVRSLRKIASKAVTSYPFIVKEIHFIQHGENTTYKVTDTRSNKYLLRVHRSGYHSINALKEELNWLKKINQKTDIVAPIPLKNTDDSFVTSCDGRNVTLLKWVEGRQIQKSVNSNHLKSIGKLTADLHINTTNLKVKHRVYWDANGLAGKVPFMGPMDSVVGLTKSEQTYLNEARSIVYKRLRTYEKANPSNMGLIHADLHFGNFFLNNSNISPIDFDDCGYGFHMYDLAVTLTSLFHGIKQKILTKSQYKSLSNDFLESYNQHITLRDEDLDLIEDMKLARRFLGTQWLNLRADHPGLKKRAVPYAKETVRIVKKELKL